MSQNSGYYVKVIFWLLLVARNWYTTQHICFLSQSNQEENQLSSEYLAKNQNQTKERPLTTTLFPLKSLPKNKYYNGIQSLL